MRTALILVLVALVSAAAAKDQPESLEALKQRAEASEGNKQIELFIKIAERQMESADKAFDAGNAEQGQAAVQDIQNYCLKAIQSSLDTHKRMKQTEIAVRKITEHLNDMKRSLSVDDRPPVAATIEKLDKARSDLLAAMFKR